MWKFVITSEEELSAEMTRRIQRRALRDNSDPLSLPENLFRSRFRLSKPAFTYLLDTLDLPTGTHSTYIPPIIRLAVFLEVLATGGYQHLVGNDYICAVSKSMVSHIMTKMIFFAETKICSKWIKFSSNNAATKEYFFTKYGIPGVIGCIDGTHVYLTKPTENEYMFFNRKGKHSLNVMMIVRMRITAVNGRFGGAAHDSFVLSQSNEKAMLETNYDSNKNSWLLGDKGYPLQPWLITPYRSPNSQAEIKFNEVHGRVRSIIERCFGVLKGVWRILIEERKSRYAPEKLAAITNVCAALHNIRIHFNIPNEEVVIFTETQEDVDVPQQAIEENRLRNEAELIRRRIANTLS